MRFIYFFILMVITSSLSAEIVIENGHIRDADDIASLPFEEHYQLACEAYQAEDWTETIRQCRAILGSYGGDPRVSEVHFIIGVAYFYYGEYEFANQELSNYLACQQTPYFMQEAVYFKFHCAEAFRYGAKRRILGLKQMPCWLDASKQAIEIYDEIIAAFPCNPLAAESLYSKGLICWRDLQYREAVEAFQTLIRRFPKHELAPECYMAMNQMYLEQAEREFQNPDILALAELNQKKFERDFPGEERISEGQSKVIQVKEASASGLYETGQFYERVKQPDAAILYYSNAVQRFPDTEVAAKCRLRLSALGAGE